MPFSLTMLFLTRMKYIVKGQKFRKVKMQPGRRKYGQFDKERVCKMTDNLCAISDFLLEISSLHKENRAEIVRNNRYIIHHKVK